MTKVLVVGGSGTIGRELVPFLQQAGYSLTILRRKKGEWDPERGYLAQEAIEGYDVIINLAGQSLVSGLWTAKQKEKILQSRVVSTRLLVQAINNLKIPPKLFISASAVGYYGD